MHLRASLLLFTVSACLGYDEVSSPEYIAKTAAEKSDIVWANLMEDTTPGDWSDQTKTSPLFIRLSDLLLATNIIGICYSLYLESK